MYDCSGFVVAAFLRAGVDLVRLNAGWSDAMFRSLPRVAQADLQTGDLLLFGLGDLQPTDPTTHVGMYLGNNLMLNSTRRLRQRRGVHEHGRLDPGRRPSPDRRSRARPTVTQNVVQVLRSLRRRRSDGRPETGG